MIEFASGLFEIKNGNCFSDEDKPLLLAMTLLILFSFIFFLKFLYVAGVGSKANTKPFGPIIFEATNEKIQYLHHHL